MQAGRQLDIEVARKVFRYVVMIEPTGGSTIWNLEQRRQVAIPQYSTRVEDAHLVMEHFQNNGWHCVINSNTDNGLAEWTAEYTVGQLSFSARSNSMTEVICKAAILAASALNTGR